MLLQLALDLQMSLKWWILLFYDCSNLPLIRFHGFPPVSGKLSPL